MPDAHPRPSLRERKKARTRQILEECAVRLFHERGFEATTVDDIAAAAEVSPRTFFRYFPTKEAALLGTGDDQVAAVLDIIRSRPLDEPLVASLRHVVLTQAGAWETERELMLDQTRLLLRTPALKARYLEMIDASAAAMADVLAERAGGGPDARLRSKVVAFALLGAANAVVEAWVEADGEEPLPALMVRALEALADGLGETGAGEPA